MIRSGFLDHESRHDLTEPARVLLGDDTIRTWYRLYQEEGIEGLASFGHEGRRAA